MTVECRCGRPIADNATLCAGCTGRLERDLGDVPALADELVTVLTRQTRYGAGNGGSRSAERPLPFDPRASEVAGLLKGALVGVVRVVMEERGEAVGEPEGDDSAALAEWLVVHVEWLRHHPAGDELVDEVTYAVSRVRGVVDRPPDQWFVGVCLHESDEGVVCRGSLYADPRHTLARCRACGSESDAAETRDRLEESMWDQLLTPAEMASMLVYFGHARDREKVRALVKTWAERGRITVRATDGFKRPLYAYREVVEHLRASQTTAA